MPDLSNPLLFTLNLSTAALCLLGMMRLAPALGLIDQPDQRKAHLAPTPHVGGVAIYLALLLTHLIYPAPGGGMSMLLALAAPMVIMGGLDDRFSLGAKFRIVIQASVALAMVYWAGVRLEDLGQLLGTPLLTLGLLAVPMTLFATVGVVNAVNFSDGLDGLAGGLVAIALLPLLLLAHLAGQAEVVSQLAALLGALFGFLLFNARYLGRRRALLFMGDSGSMFLGLLLAWHFISLSQGPQRLITPVTALWLFALPLFDTVGIMTRRILRGRSPFTADREHLHHILELAGFTTCQTVNILLGFALLLGLIGVAGLHFKVPEAVMFYGFLALFTAYFWAMMRAWRLMKVLRALHD